MHHCGKVAGYNVWPRIINEVIISLDPSKNQEVKHSLKLNDFVTKVPLQKDETSLNAFQKEEASGYEKDGEGKSEDEHSKGRDLHKSHLVHTLQSLQYIKTLPLPPKAKVDGKAVNLPPPRNKSIKKTVIFDLDETLVHCVDDPSSMPCDVVLQIKFPSGDVADAGINIRPYALECLREAR